MGFKVRSLSLAVACALAISAVTFAAALRNLDIPAGDLAAALSMLAKQADVELVFQQEQVEGLKTDGLRGTYPAREAIALLLKGTRLQMYADPSGAIVIAPVAEATGKTGALAQPGSNKEGKSNSSSGFLGADQAPQGGAAQSSSVEQGGNLQTLQKAPGELDEVVVTAQKRAERLQDVPVPVTALNTDALVDSNALRLQDYFTSVPGLTVTPSDMHGAPIITIRGIASGAFTNPTVGIMVDDEPYGSSATSFGAQEAPDIDPGDLARIEVLRGPQGTLYGASSMGGLIKFVTVDPSTAGVSGRVQAGTSSVYNGAQPGYNVRAAVNVPLSDTWAVRVSGFTRRDPGYINNPVLDIQGVNRVDVGGGRLSALWRPATDFSVKFSAMLQSTKAFGSPEVDPSLGDLRQNALPGTGAYDKKIELYSATLNAKLGGFDLTAITGYNLNRISDSFDYTFIYAPFTQKQFGVPGTPLLDHFKTKKFTEEIRISGSPWDKVDWLFGLFYTHENNELSQGFAAADPTTGALVGSWDLDVAPTTYAEYAAFTDFTFHFTDRFDVQVGGRESQNRQTYSDTITGPIDAAIYLLPSPIINPEVRTKDSSFTYLLTPRFRVSSELMAYARLASGYRPGGPNPTCVVFGVPCRYGPDKTSNYELGVKGDALSHTVSFDASLYYIDWKDIQLIVFGPSGGYYTNASRAKSQGLELSGQLRPLNGLTITGWMAWNEAILTEGFPPSSQNYGVTGDRLPYSSRFSANVALEQEFPLGDRIVGSAGATMTYVGDRVGVFTARLSPERQSFPSYGLVDLRAGLKYGSWGASLFVTNVGDKRVALTGGRGTLNPALFNYTLPRTAGVSLFRTF